MSETVVIKREDLEELKEAFNYLMEENKTLKEEIEAATKPEEIDIDLSGYREMFVMPEEKENVEECDPTEDDEETTVNSDLDLLINPTA
jgi:regulator of replication initiation timing